MAVSDIRILYKILGCFALLSIITGGGVWYATSSMTEIDRNYSDLIERDVQGMKRMMQAEQRVFNFGRLSWRMIAETEVAQMEGTSREIAANQTGFAAEVADARNLLPAMTGQLDEAAALFDDIYRRDFAAIEKATLANRNAEASRLAEAMAVRTAELRRRMAAITAAVDKIVKARSDALTETTLSIARLSMIAVGGAFVLVLTLAVGIIRFGITAPLARLVGDLKRLARGEEVEVAGTGRRDEIGEVAEAVQGVKLTFADKARREAEEKAEAERRAVAERRTGMVRLADEFDRAVGQIVETVSSASNELEAAASSLTRTAETTQGLATTVAAASDQASSNVQSVASATNEMASSVGEIGRQVQESTRIAGEAVRQAEKTDVRIGELSQAAGRIGDVVKLITAIAEQTNLLALNATIEAARAGEAGKGFAVVAQEVKALAAQTGKATGEISTQIAGMQQATQDSVVAIKEIGGTIARIAEIATAIAAAVEQQGAATGEIARNVQQAARGTTEVADTIAGVNRGAAETGSASSQVLSSAQSLSRESARLKVEVARFLAGVRAA
ncbi:MAG: methyl-accepting chemotaxis protein [Rhodovulum sp.]|nr:methyl-accepting chemotaxis protein [Rhodovulum sp.]